MKHIIRKAYINFEKEEKWLNEMSAKGFALTDYSFCRYVFTECEPGEYIYRLELLENLPSHPESVKYIRFMEENGVEFVSSYFRWVYFRKKASDGAFDIYSDTDSKIKHYKRINRLMLSLALLNLAICTFNTIIPSIHFLLVQTHPLNTVNLLAGSINGVLFLILGIVSHPIRKKLKVLKQHKNIME